MFQLYCCGQLTPGSLLKWLHFPEKMSIFIMTNLYKEFFISQSVYFLMHLLSKWYQHIQTQSSITLFYRFISVLYLPLYLLWIPILLSCGKNVKTICVYRSNVHPSDHAQRQQAEYLIWLMYFKWLDAFLKDKHVCLWKNLRVGITIT
jgi:hypothetical protein